MSLVQSRPASQASLTARLPQIQHPLAAMQGQNGMELELQGIGGVNSRANSRLGGSRPVSVASASGRPLANENGVTSPRKSAASGRVSRHNRMSADKQVRDNGVMYESIPENCEVTVGDPTKARLPIFGNRADIASRAGSTYSQPDNFQARVASRLSTANSQQRLEIDELEMLLREKVKTCYFELKKKFKDVDPQEKGNVSRDALFRILVTTLNRPMNPNQFNKLMDRLGFGKRLVLSFQEFNAAFREVDNNEYPRWMDPVQRQWKDKDTMTATQVHHHLKEKAKQKIKDIADLIPQTNPDGAGHILKPEFKNTLNKMGFFMDDVEFERLWQRYDPDGLGTINGEKMMQKLGISFNENEMNAEKERLGYERNEVRRPMKKKEADRKRSLDIENWLKNKFREGFAEMKCSFEEYDKDCTGLVCHDHFLSVLNKCGLSLEKSHLAEFLARCNVQPTNKDVPYREFLHRFQDRSEGGMAHKILTNPKHGYNRAESPSNRSTMTALESQLMNMFQKDFLALLGMFHKIDKLGLDVVSQEEFRAAIESRFELEMTQDQFKSLIDRVPLDEEGNVRYADFMAQFDTKGKAQSLFNGEPMVRKNKYKAVGVLPRDRTPSPPVLIMDEPKYPSDSLVVDNGPTGLPDVDYIPPRSSSELFKVLKELLKTQYQAVEAEFCEMDEMNTGRLTQEMMYQLLKKFDLDPEVTRGEIRDIWKTFITQTDKTLDFHQFARHFGYSLKSAAFPNAKAVPPRKGDSDFQLRSRKLNCAADMLQDSLRSKIDYLWEDLRREFVAMDPYGTGCVSREEFQDVMSELCVHLSDYELKMLTRKFTVPGDGEERVSYVELLKPFALKKQTWRHGNNMLALLQQPHAGLPIADIVEPPQKGLYGITAKLRQKLTGDWKNLRRAFKKLDTNNQGYLSLPEFRSVLKLANVVLDEDEIYHIMSQFDEDMTGQIKYHKFLNETFKPASRQSQNELRRSAHM